MILIFGGMRKIEGCDFQLYGDEENSCCEVEFEIPPFLLMERY